MSPDTSTAAPHVHEQRANAVRLSGRVSAAPEARMLPSGDEVVSFRLIVSRSPAALRWSKQLVDTIECSAWTARLRRSVRRLEAGDIVTVTGELRRRFSRGARGPMSWVNVDIETCERTAAPPSADG
jgi:single-strand DNA-binding protein